MKNNIKSFQDFEIRLKNEIVPKSSCNSISISKALSRKRQQPTVIRKSVIIAFFTIFITATLATANELTGWRLFDNEGKQLLTVDSMIEDEAEMYKDIREIIAPYETTIKDLKTALPEGKCFYFLAVEAYEKYGMTSVYAYQNDQPLKNINELPVEIRERFHLSEDLLGLNSFSGGVIIYKQPDMNLEEAISRNEAMYVDAKKKKAPYIIREENLTTDIASLNLTYNNGLEHVQIAIVPSTNNGLAIMSETKQDYTKLVEKDIEFLFNQKVQELYFVKEEEGQKYMIHILGSKFLNEEKIGPEKLMTVARKILNW
ncbi:hypothetical protein ACVNNN_22890 [Lysinibacillus fusiformis]|uniref:hypothetical protein n=1 Tax=Lysinibacillus sp. PWR01 TaxID=3342384 RepID=UPI00372D5704